MLAARNSLRVLSATNRLQANTISSRDFIRHVASATTAVAVPTETLRQKALRWADVNGFFTLWYSRKAWVMNDEPNERPACIMVTEYERKLMLWMCFMNWLMFPFSIWYWWGTFTHLASKPPLGQNIASPNFDNRGNDYTWNCHSPLIAAYCKDCRMFEIECKKWCFDKLEEIGYTKGWFTKGWQFKRPRTQSVGGH